MATITLEVVEIETDKVVHTVDVRGQSERGVERILRGMLINMDRDRFFVREVEEGEPTPEAP